MTSVTSLLNSVIECIANQVKERFVKSVGNRFVAFNLLAFDGEINLATQSCGDVTYDPRQPANGCPGGNHPDRGYRPPHIPDAMLECRLDLSESTAKRMVEADCLGNQRAEGIARHHELAHTVGKRVYSLHGDA